MDLYIHGYHYNYEVFDLVLCNLLPIGTHFLWHILAAFAGYQAIVLLSVLNKSQQRK